MAINNELIVIIARGIIEAFLLTKRPHLLIQLRPVAAIIFLIDGRINRHQFQMMLPYPASWLLLRSGLTVL